MPRVTREWEEAVRRGDVADLERLLAAGVDLDARNRRGQTALMLAAQHGRLEAVRFLVAHGAALDHTAKYGLSALMLAVINGHAAVVRVLARAGANRSLRGTGAPGFLGKTALDLATARARPDLLDALAVGEERPDAAGS